MKYLVVEKLIFISMITRQVVILKKSLFSFSYKQKEVKDKVGDFKRKTYLYVCQAGKEVMKIITDTPK